MEVPVGRQQLLLTVGAGTVVGLTGCLGSSGEDDPGADADENGPVADESIDEGTHYKAYSPQNGLVYAEYGDRTIVVDSDTNDVADELDSFAVVDHVEVEVEVEGGVDTVQYIGDSGTGYTGRLR